MNGLSKKLAHALPLISMSFAATSEIHNKLVDTQTPPLLLAKNIQKEYKIEHFLVSEKYDGIRAYWNGVNLLSRSGKIINAPAWFTKYLPSVPLDGELWMARGKFEALASITRKKNATDNEWKQIKYMIFDLPSDLSPFEQRYEKLKALVEINPVQNIVLVEQIKLNSDEALKEHFSTLVAKGAEGLMLHKTNSLYQAKRSSDLQKLKPFDDAEATVVAYIEGKGKYQGLLGAIEVINDDGKKFKIGSGFSLQERQSPPPINSRVTYRYRGKTKYNTPRFATYLRQALVTD
jgi:DNA ligase-1